MHDPVYTEETATDAEGAHALLAAAYGAGSMRFEPSGDLIFGRRRQDLGEVRVDEVQYSFLSEYDMDPLGYVLILRMRDGEMEFTGERGPSRRTAPVTSSCAPSPMRATTRSPALAAPRRSAWT